MKDAKSILFLVIAIMLFINYSGFSQNQKRAVILYNTKPVLAVITTDGNVKQIIAEAPNYLVGYTLNVQDYGLKAQQVEVAAVNPIKTEQTTELSVNVQDVNNVKVDQNLAYVSVESKSVYYDPGFATLSAQAIKTLDEIVATLEQNPTYSIILRTLTVNEEETLLSKNRINSMRSYLKVRGIATERVSFELLKGEVDLNEIKIHVIR